MSFFSNFDISVTRAVTEVTPGPRGNYRHWDLRSSHLIRPTGWLWTAGQLFFIICIVSLRRISRWNVSYCEVQLPIFRTWLPHREILCTEAIQRCWKIVRSHPAVQSHPGWPYPLAIGGIFILTDHCLVVLDQITFWPPDLPQLFRDFDTKRWLIFFSTTS